MYFQLLILYSADIYANIRHHRFCDACDEDVELHAPFKGRSVLKDLKVICMPTVILTYKIISTVGR